MSEVDKLKQLRAAHRLQIEKFVCQADVISTKLKNLPQVEEDDRWDHLLELQAVQASLNAKIEILKTNDQKIIGLTAAEDIITTSTEADDYLHDICTKAFKLQVLVDGLTKPPPETPAHPQQQKTTNLPKLQLPTFEGNVLDWTAFYDAFKSAVGDNKTLTPVQKFQYLRAQLKNDALKFITGLSVTDENYEHALDLLKKRYGQKSKIINAHMTAMWDLQTPIRSAESLRQFHDTLETHIRGLKALGKDECSYGDLLVPIVMRKLPGETRTQITRDHNNEECWDLTSLKKAIEQEIEALESASQSTDIAIEDNFSPALLTNSSKNRHFNRAGNTVRPRNYGTDKFCAFCKQNNHYSTECRKVTGQQRWDLVKQERKCFNCLGNHLSRDCKSAKTCRICREKHHTALHTDKGSPGANSRDKPGTKLQLQPKNEHQLLAQTDNEMSTEISNERNLSNVLLKTAVAEVCYQGNRQTANIMFDEGASRSYLAANFAREISIKPHRQEVLRIAVFGDSNPRSRVYDLAYVEVLDIHNQRHKIEVVLIPEIAVKLPTVTCQIAKLPHLKGLRLAHPPSSNESFTIDMLIGADLYWNFVGDKVIRGPGPTAVSSSLGYLISGPTSKSNIQKPHVDYTYLLTETKDDSLSLQKFWNLETLGIKEQAETPQDTLTFESYRDNNLRKVNGQYVAKLPWKQDCDRPPTNYYQTLNQTRNMIRKLDPETRVIYDQIINEQLYRGFVELVPNDDGKGHYLPHHAVTKESTTTPIRVVHNCSFRTKNNPSLNDCLHVGPPMLNYLAAILLRFRLNATAVSSDIEKAFLHIGLDEDDRKYTKFFWLSDPTDPESELKVIQFRSILFGCISSSFVLNAVIRTQLEQNDCEISQLIKDDIYVDNVLSSFSDNALEYFQIADEIMKNGGFVLRSVATNDKKLQEYAKINNIDEKEETVNLTGMKWNTTRDTIGFKELPNATPITTKREVVKLTSSLYDPLGYLSPVHVKAKMFIQNLWKLDYNWDEILDQELSNDWKNIEADLRNSVEISLNRQFLNFDPDQECEIHSFVDSSQKAFGSAIYVVQNNQSAIVMAKNRVAPVKTMTLPRLELMGAVIGARLLKFVTESLQNRMSISKTVLWSDSTIVLSWLKSEKALPCFVNNRVKEIKELLPNSEFNHVPTEENPADLLTRGLSTENLKNSELWWNGPTWITDSEQWPKRIDQSDRIDHVEVISSTNKVKSNNEKADLVKYGLDKIMDIDSYSSLTKLLRQSALVLRYNHNLKNPEAKITGEISAREIKNAEREWIIAIQKSYYAKELVNLKSEKVKHGDLVTQLNLFIDENGIIRTGSRLHNSSIPYGAKFPILLPHDHTFTRLVILFNHRKCKHQRVSGTVSKIRQTYWITRIRVAVRSVLRKCVTCALMRGKAFRGPITPPLPAFRVQDVPPFTVTGVDYTGEIITRTKSVPPIYAKRYICLFTCATTRAVHLELVSDQTTSSFLRAFRRFAARRSLPNKMVSDNASYFQCASEELKRIVESQTVSRYMANNRVEWSFIVKKAPWHGGYWEKMIGLVKSCLNKILRRALVSDDELHTLLCEIEASVNDRPLTYVYSEENEPTPLCPSELICGRQITTLPYGEIDLDDPDYNVTYSDIQRRHQYLNRILSDFRNRWNTDYLTTLKEHHKLTHGPIENTVKVGDVVLIENKDKNRKYWKLAVVKKLNVSPDKLVRSVELKTANGMTNRPIQKLYPIEVSAPPEDISVTQQNSDDTKTVTTRPKREAAKKALENIKNWTKTD